MICYTIREYYILLSYAQCYKLEDVNNTGSSSSFTRTNVLKDQKRVLRMLYVRTSRSYLVVYDCTADRKSQEKDFVYRLRNTYNTSLLEISYCYNDCTFSFPFCFYSHLFVIDIPITYPRRQPHYLSCESTALSIL